MRNDLVLCVLGMHRSGTSLTTSLLPLLDVELGPEEHLIPPDNDNPLGFWEHRALTRLNDEILSKFGGSWSQPPVLPEGWESSASLAGLRRRARAAVERDFGGAERWAWKDPRTCLTLPFWQELVRPTHYVLCLRNPVDVATSLHRRSPETISLAGGAQLWVAYIEAALRGTAGGPRLVVFYEDLMRSPRKVFARLGDFVGRPSLAAATRTRKRLRRTISEELWHHRTHDGAVLDDDRVPFPAKALYLALRLDADQPTGSTRPLEALAAHAASALAETSRQRSCAGQLDLALADLERARREGAAAANLRIELDAARGKADELEAALREALTARDAIGDVRRAVGDVAHRLGGQDELLHSLTTTVERTLSTSDATRQLAYDALISRFRAAVNSAVPESATVAVVSRGDDRLLDLGDRRCWHFPRTPEGQYAGHYPPRGEDAIKHLESLRAEGAEFLAFPSTALWWLDHYPELREHLELRYRCSPSEEPCAVFDLRVPESRLPALRRLATALRSGRRSAPHASPVGPSESTKGLLPADNAASPQHVLAQDLAEGCTGAATSGPLVSIVILNRDGEHHLRRCFDGLAPTAYEPFEVIVVDNGSTDGSRAFLEEQAATLPVRVLANDDNRSFSQANNQGAQAAGGSLLLFLNNDVEPIGPDWLGRLVRTLNDEEAAAVGARLVYPERPGLDNAGDLVFPDLSLQHRGIHLAAGDGGASPAKPRLR